MRHGTANIFAPRIKCIRPRTTLPSSILLCASNKSWRTNAFVRGRGMQYELTVKWQDYPLGHFPLTVSLPEALLKGKQITQDYFTRWNLGSI